MYCPEYRWTDSNGLLLFHLLASKKFCFTVNSWLPPCITKWLQGLLGSLKATTPQKHFSYSTKPHLEIWVWFYFHPYHCYWKSALESHSSLTTKSLFLISSLGEITASSSVFLITKTHLKIYQNIAPYTFREKKNKDVNSYLG